MPQMKIWKNDFPVQQPVRESVDYKALNVYDVAANLARSNSRLSVGARDLQK